jgi:hypothetical protein
MGGRQIRIEAHDLPGRECGPSPDKPDGYHDIHVGVQHKRDREQLLGLTPGDASSATWTVEVPGPYISGRPNDQFVYLSWVARDAADRPFEMFRRAKLMLDAMPEGERVFARIGMTDPKGNPTCAALRPPRVEWSAE